jgi:uncharacterized protein
MRLEWDEKKRAANLRKHGLDFADSPEFDFDGAVYGIDDREDYGELREIAVGFLRDRLCVLTFTMRGDVMRIVSLRKADKKDVKFYAANTRTDT